jgi:hypothetical protein
MMKTNRVESSLAVKVPAKVISADPRAAGFGKLGTCYKQD